MRVKVIVVVDVEPGTKMETVERAVSDALVAAGGIDFDTVDAEVADA